MNRALQYLFLQDKKIGFARLTLPLSKKRKIELIPAQIDLCLYLRPSSIHLYKTSLEEMSETKFFCKQASTIWNFYLPSPDLHNWRYNKKEFL